MMRTRLRPTPDAEGLRHLYSKRYSHTSAPDHVLRVAVTAALAEPVTPIGGVVADLSCGDAAIANLLASRRNARLVLGDLTPGHAITGPIEETISQIPDGSVDLFICSETVEHVDDPDAVLAAIRPRTSRLILSTPDGETDTRNPEHIWGWDSEAMGDMLRSAGFRPEIHTTLDLRPSGGWYSFQIWLCS